jgi:hypothetical protein
MIGQLEQANCPATVHERHQKQALVTIFRQLAQFARVGGRVTRVHYRGNLLLENASSQRKLRQVIGRKVGQPSAAIVVFGQRRHCLGAVVESG